MSGIRVVIADAHPVIRLGMRKLLEQSAGIEVIGEATDGDQALKMAEELSPDVLLLDMEIPNQKGVEVTRIIREKQLPVKILAMSADDEKDYVHEVLSNGASGYLMKDEQPDVIIEAVRGVARGEQGWFSQEIGSRITELIQEDEKDANITPRELEVLCLVVEGKTNQEIGYELGISEKTVEKHLESIFEKLGVSSRVEAAVYAVKEGIVNN
jgi:two-component system, NarL family, response regulator DegU